MVIITSYRQEKRGDKIYIHSDESSACPICLSRLKVIGSRHRKLIGTDGKLQTFVIRRLRCKGCGKVHHELPDLLIPYKRHCAERIEQAVSEGEKETDVSDNEQAGIIDKTTIKRIKNWWSAMSLYFYGVLLSFEAKYDLTFPATIKLREIVRAVANQQLWVHTRSACLSM